MPADITVHSLGKRQRLDFPLLVWRFGKLIRRLKPDVVVSFLWYADLIQLLARSGRTKVVCSIHAVATETRRSRFGVLKIALLRLLYPRADAILVLSAANKTAFCSVFKRIRSSRLQIQSNPFDLDLICKLGEQPLERPTTGQTELVAVGRLDEVKGLDRLLDAVAALGATHNWRLRFVGEGPLQKSLQEQALRLGIAARISFEGFRENPYPYIKAADVLVLTSHFEAYPNSIVEALALGTAVIAVDCPYGPREILGGGAGILVPANDRGALTRSLELLLEDEPQRRQLERQGPLAVASMDSVPVTRRLEDILDTI